MAEAAFTSKTVSRLEESSAQGSVEGRAASGAQGEDETSKAENAEGRNLEHLRAEHAARLPRENGLLELEIGTVTLLVRNIPARWSQGQLLSEWSHAGFDMLYLPFNARINRPTGRAYINFPSTEAAEAFQAAKQGTFLTHHGPGKHLDIAAAPLQGIEANLMRFHGQPWPEEKHSPAVFRGSQRVRAHLIFAELGIQPQRALEAC